ncbi:MAG: hypothetical protein R2831_11810 [Chitinophagaceae bacterium]
MKNFSTYILIFFVFITATLGCKKPKAGLGGQANLVVVAKHHTAVIDSATVYIKFNTKEAPLQLSSYDLKQTIQSTSSNTIFEGLKKGDYYIYAEGWDESIQAAVKGGLPYTIKEEITLNIDVAVTETH